METKDRVALWQGELTIPTYEPEPAEKLPMFYELRNYQNTKGDIYPLAATEKIRNEKTPHTYQAVSLENQYVKTTVLPELGGRVYEGLDKTDGYDFVYKNRVIKPALIGLCGPWVSGKSTASSGTPSWPATTAGTFSTRFYTATPICWPTNPL